MPGEINPTLRHLHLFDLLLPLLAALAMTTTMTSVATATTTTTSCRMSEDQPDPAEDDHLPPPLRVVVNDTDHLSCYPVREATCANDRRMVCVESDACRGRRRTTTTTRRRRRRRLVCGTMLVIILPADDSVDAS